MGKKRVRERRFTRLETYDRALRPIERGATFTSFRRLSFAAVVGSEIFVITLPMLVVDYYRVGFNFFCAVYGFLLAMHLARVAICQNVAVSRVSNNLSSE